MEFKSRKNNHIKKSSKIPLSIKIYFLILHLFFAQDFGFQNLMKKRTADILKYYSALLTLTNFVILVWPFMIAYQDVWYWCAILQCVANFCILTNSAKYTMYNFLSDIHAAERIAALETETFGIIMATYIAIMYIGKELIFAFSCMFDFNAYCDMNYFNLVLYAISCHAVDFMQESQILVRLYIYLYVKNMERSLKEDQDISKFIVRYDRIADCQDKIRRLSDYFVSICI